MWPENDVTFVWSEKNFAENNVTFMWPENDVTFSENNVTFSENDVKFSENDVTSFGPDFDVTFFYSKACIRGHDEGTAMGEG